MTNLEWWLIEQKNHFEIEKVLREQSTDRPWAAYFLNDSPFSTADFNSVCRLGFVPFAHCIQDRYFLIDKSRTPEILAAGGITTQIHWDFNPETLPAGWQGSVRQSYDDAKSKSRIPNTQVALLAFTTKRFRGRGMSGKMLSKMCLTAKSRGYRYLIVPALPPTQFQKKYANTSIEIISNLKRQDGEYYDYWTRLHTRKGATIIGHCAHSHRFVYSLDDFSRHISSDPIKDSGEYIVRLDRDQMLGPNNKDMWQLVYADVERSFVIFNWGCVWVQYDLQALNFSLTDEPEPLG